MIPDTVTVRFRGQPVPVSGAVLREAVAELDTIRAVRRVLPAREERQALGLVTVSDAAEFLHALHRAMASHGLPRLRGPRGRGRRRGPRITR